MSLVNYTPNPTATAFHRDPSPIKAFCGPVGSGKSTVAIWEFALLCMDSTVPVRGVVIRESYRELKDSTQKTWTEWFGAVSDYKEKDETARLRIPGKDGVVRTHELLFRSCRKPEEASKFLSTEFGFCWLEEICPAFQTDGVMGGGLDQGIFNIAQMRVRQRGVPRHQIVLTFNPPTTYHWAYTEFFKRKESELKEMGYALYRSVPRENSQNLPDKYYDRLLSRLSPDLARRFVEGEVIAVYPGERVYKECRDNYHIVDDTTLRPRVPLVLGFDFGRTPCALVCQVCPDGQLLVHKEVQLWDASAETLAEHLIPLLNSQFTGLPWRCWGDPAGVAKGQGLDASPFEVLERKGFHVEPGAIDLFTRKEVIKQRFARTTPSGAPAVLISRSGCPLLSEGMLGAYRYPRSVDGRLSEAPVKNEASHLANALEYIGTGEFSVLSGFQPTTRHRVQKDEGKLPAWNPLESNKSGGSGGWMSN